MKKIIFVPILIIILIVLFYPYSLRSDYKKALNYCILQIPSARGEFEVCMVDYLIQKNRKNYDKYKRINSFCDFLYNSEYDKEQCMDRIMLYPYNYD